MTAEEREVLCRIEGKVDNCTLSIVRLAAQFGTAERDVGELKDTVYGNGKEGLKTTITRLIERDETRRRILLASIAVVGLATGAVGAEVLRRLLGA